MTGLKSGRARLHAALSCVLLSLAVAAAARAQHDRPETQAAMQQIFASMRILLPLAVSPDGFGDPSQREQIEAALQTLVAQAGQLDGHAKGFDAAGRYIGRSLAHDARRALDQFRGRSFESSEFYLLQTAESCVGCHARLPSGDSPVATGFFDSKELGELPTLGRAKLQIATRRFDEALQTLEGAFRDPYLEPATLLSSLTEYLTVCIRVKRDLARPVPTLQEFSRRADLWAQLRTDVEAWVSALGEHASWAADEDDPIESARKLIDSGTTRLRYPTDRSALVHYLLASRTLHEFTSSHRETDSRLAEAYYLLGLTEARIGRSFWLSQADFYLETAVRMDPRSPIGRDAFALLEEETLLGYTGSSGLHLPDDERERLEELRALIDPTPPATGAPPQR